MAEKRTAHIRIPIRDGGHVSFEVPSDEARDVILEALRGSYLCRVFEDALADLEANAPR